MNGSNETEDRLLKLTKDKTLSPGNIMAMIGI